MKGERVPDTDHVLRYVQPKCIEIVDGVPEIQGTAFYSRPRDNHMPSFNWMECHEGSQDNQVREIRRATRLTYRVSGLLAQLNVGVVMSALHEAFDGACASEFIHDPLDADENFPLADISHSVMTNMPADGERLVEAMGDVLAECVMAQYPTRE